MEKNNDYRNTAYCPVLDKVDEQKRALVKEIEKASPRTKIIYNKVRERGSIYHKKFAKIYNEKCAYCGAVLGWLPVEPFEVDHFINEDSFPDTIEGRIEAGKISNLAWACVSCNRGKRGITIEPPYDSLLNVDNGNITHVFRRDEDFYIRICDTYQEDEFIQKFYHALHLGYETRRLDYFALKLEGKCNEEKDENRKLVLLEQLKCLRNRRNHMAVSSGA